MAVAAMRFGERLKKLRTKAGMTQEQLARAADVTVAAVRNLEQTDAEPTWATARAIATALGVSLDKLAEE